MMGQDLNIEFFHKCIEENLSTFPEKTVHGNGRVTIKQIEDTYFLEKNQWHIDYFVSIKQFADSMASFATTRKNINFRFNNPTLNLEMKHVFFRRVFSGYWTINTIFGSKQNPLKRLAEFMNERHPLVSSFLELNLDEIEEEYILWLKGKGTNTKQVKRNVLYTDVTIKSTAAAFLRTIYKALTESSDQRPEWHKDRWDIRVLHDSYGIHYNKSLNSYYLNFLKIDENVREEVKKYFKQRLLSKNSFSWSTALSYQRYLTLFFTFIFSLEPDWKDIKNLDRSHMEEYIEYLHKYANDFDRNNSHPESFVSNALHILNRFIEDLQLFEYRFVPKTPIRLLLYREDMPRLRKKSLSNIDYIPDFVLDQLFNHIDDVHEEITPVIWISFKTGLRISDVLGLTTECLQRENKNYSLLTDIQKTLVRGHRIPVDDQIANIIMVLIKQSKDMSNLENNPDQLIFVRLRGQRKGNPFSQNWIRRKLNEFALKNNITDEMGHLFHFKTHQFRHTYAVKMLNAGADIGTIQELLAHASPEMTMRYAKLLDGTKRIAFESVFKTSAL